MDRVEIVSKEGRDLSLIKLCTLLGRLTSYDDTWQKIEVFEKGVHSLLVAEMGYIGKGLH